MRSGLWLTLVLVACTTPNALPGYPCLTGTESSVIENTHVDSVDLLLVVDDSPAMAPFEAHVRDQIALMVTELASGQPPSPSMAFAPPRSIHIGVVSTSMGLGPTASVAGCPSGFGDDGILHATCAGAAVTRDACTIPNETCPPGVFEFMRGQDASGRPTASSYAGDVACVAALGTSGCELEFPLESALKALAPAPDATGASSVPWTAPGYTPPNFAQNTFGHGADPMTNGGFLRAGSVLAILLFANEDDGSTNHDEIFGDTAPYNADPVNVRPIFFAASLFPIARYVDGLIGLRRSPSTLFFSVVAGIPTDLSPPLDEPTTPALLQQLIADPRMIPMIDPSHADRLVPVCTSATGATAAPAIRLVEVAQGLQQRGASVSVRSICDADFTAVVDDLASRIAPAIDGDCLARALPTDTAGNVECEVLEALPASGPVVHCADLAHPEAYTLVRTEPVTLPDGTTGTREVCRVRQVGRAGAAADVAGWAYDDGNPALGAFTDLPLLCGQAIHFTSEIETIAPSEIQLRCSLDVFPSVPVGSPTLAQACDPTSGNTLDNAMPCSNGHAQRGFTATLRCDAFSRSCAMPCTSDADCTNGGVTGATCDLRTATDYFGSAGVPMSITPTTRRGFCSDPCAQ
jgi:hypothetical protein